MNKIVITIKISWLDAITCKYYLIFKFHIASETATFFYFLVFSRKEYCLT